MASFVETVEAARKKEFSWGEDEVIALLKRLRDAIPDSTVSWDPPDENWARVIVNKDVAAFVHASLPLLVIRNDYASLVKLRTARKCQKCSQSTALTRRPCPYQRPCLNAFLECI